jgi:hypothetical protein
MFRDYNKIGMVQGEEPNYGSILAVEQGKWRAVDVYTTADVANCEQERRPGAVPPYVECNNQAALRKRAAASSSSSGLPSARRRESDRS